MKKLIFNTVIVMVITIGLIISCGGQGSEGGFAPPSKPSPASGGVIATRFPILNWEDVPEAVKYELQVCEQNDFVNNIIEVIINPASEYQCVVELNQMTYYWRVRAQNSGGAWTEWSETWSFTVDLGVMVPGNPDPVPDEFIYDTEPLFDWEDIVSASEYEIKVSEVSDFSSYIVGPDVTVTESEYQVSSPLEFKTYYWRVRVKNDEGTWEEWSDLWSFSVYLIMQPYPHEAIIVDETPLLDWEEYWEDQTGDNAQYQVEISDTENFSNILISSGTIDDAEYQVGTALNFHVPYYWRVRVRLAAGASWSNWSRTFGFIVTNLPPPNVTGDTPTNDNTPTWSWTQPSPSTVEYRHSFTDGSNWTETTDTYYTPAIPLSDGPKTLFVQGGDGLGNWSLTSGSHTITVDTTPPSPPTVSSSSHSVQSNWYNDNTPSFSWSVSPPDATGIQGYSYEIDQVAITTPDTTPETSGPPWTSSPLSPDGTYYFHVRALDNAGNWGSAEHFQVNIDVTPPSGVLIFSSTHPNEAVWYDNDEPSFSWSSASDATSDIQGYSWLINTNPSVTPNTTVNTSEITLSLTSSDGTWYLHVRAVDNAGNGGPTDHFQVNIDTSGPPAPTISSPGSHPDQGAWYSDNTVYFEWTEPSDFTGIWGYSYEITTSPSTIPDETRETTTVRSYTSSVLSNGTHWFHVRAQDNLGHWGSTGHFSVHIDTASPGTPNPDDGITGWTNGTPDPTFSWSNPGDTGGSGVAGYYYEIGDSTPDIGPIEDLSVQLSVTQGTHTFYVQAVDHAGNRGGVGSHIIQVDTTGPGTPSPDDGISGWTNNTNPTFTWSNPGDTGGSGVEGYYYEVDDDTPDNWTTLTEVTLAVPPGEHTFYVQARDNAGNLGGAGSHTIQIYKKITASEGATGDRFGSSVAVSNDGSTIVVGAHQDDDVDSQAGSVYVYRWNGSSWVEQEIFASDGESGDFFGYSVAVDGDGSTVVVGAYFTHYYDPTERLDVGSVYVYEWDGSSHYGVYNGVTGNYDENHEIMASDWAENDFFGWDVAISDDGHTIVVGSPQDDDNGAESGSAYMFQWNGSSWAQNGKIDASDGAGGDEFGYSVDCAVVSDAQHDIVSGKIIVGANLDDYERPAGVPRTNAGSAYVYEWNGSSWVEEQKLTASDGEGYDYFGCSVSISADNNTVAVGAYYEDWRSGAVYAYEWDGSNWGNLNGTTSHYDEDQKITASDKDEGDRFGFSTEVSSDGSTIVTGAYGDDNNNDGIYDNPEYIGSVYVYERDGASWTNPNIDETKIAASDGVAGDRFGYAVAIPNDGSVIVVGAHGDESYTGSVYRF